MAVTQQQSDTVKVSGISWFERAWYMLLALIRSTAVLIFAIGILLIGVALISESNVRVIAQTDEEGCITSVYATNHPMNDQWVVRIWGDKPADDGKPDPHFCH